MTEPEMQAEIERLRALLDESHQEGSTACQEWAEKYDAAQARVVELEGALRRLVTEWDVPANDRIERERQATAIESAVANARALLPGGGK